MPAIMTQMALWQYCLYREVSRCMLRKKFGALIKRITRITLEDSGLSWTPLEYPHISYDSDIYGGIPL